MHFNIKSMFLFIYIVGHLSIMLHLGALLNVVKFYYLSVLIGVAWI